VLPGGTNKQWATAAEVAFSLYAHFLRPYNDLRRSGGCERLALCAYLCCMIFQQYRWLRHLLFWLVYWGAMGFISGGYDLLFGRAYAAEAIKTPLKLALVYAVLARTPVLGKGNWWRWVLEMMVLLFVAGCIARIQMYYVIFPWFYAVDNTINFWDHYRFLLHIVDLALVLFLVLSLRFAQQYMNFALQKQALLLEKTTAELHALRTQTNPHFLFNTLTNVYTLARKNAPETADVVLRLSKIMRYMLSEGSAASVPVSKEISVIHDYIALEHLRFGARLHVEETITIDQAQTHIPPLLLLPFFENAMKHGAGESRHDIRIKWKINISHAQLYFYIENTCENTNFKPDMNKSGTGLRNIKRQLELLFPNAHVLDIQDNGDRFVVSLHLNLSHATPKFAELPDR
jgi:two-component system, LytTR family, sensor kinase